MLGATDFINLTDIQLSNPDKSLVNGKWNVNIRGMEIQSEDMSLSVVSNPESQLANINADKALPTDIIN